MSLVDLNGVTLKSCANPGCGERAIVYPEIAVPPIGHGYGPALKLVVGLALCPKHGRAERPETFLTPSFRAMCAAMAKGWKTPPDFDRAKITLRPVGDDRWQAYQRNAEQARQGRARRSLH